MKALTLVLVGIAPWLLLLVVSRIEAAIGRAGLTRLGEGDVEAHYETNSGAGDSGAPSPRKRLFMVGGRRNGKRWVDTGKETAA